MTTSTTLSTYEWWAARRWRYNLGLIIAGPAAYIAYGIMYKAFEDRFPDAEITVFTLIFQAIGYLFMIGVANILYFLGPICEKVVAPNDPDRFRRRLFAVGFWFSFALPFVLPAFVLAYALLRPPP